MTETGSKCEHGFSSSSWCDSCSERERAADSRVRTQTQNSFRRLAEQLAATGKSLHSFGLAMDINGTEDSIDCTEEIREFYNVSNATGTQEAITDEEVINRYNRVRSEVHIQRYQQNGFPQSLPGGYIIPRKQASRHNGHEAGKEQRARTGRRSRGAR